MYITILLHTLRCIGLSLLLSLLLMCCTACSEQEFDVEHPDVSLFVRQLKAGHYVAQTADGLAAWPKFTLEDIEELLDALTRYQQWWKDRQLPRTAWTIDPCYDEPLCGSHYMWW